MHSHRTAKESYKYNPQHNSIYDRIIYDRSYGHYWFDICPCQRLRYANQIHHIVLHGPDQYMHQLWRGIRLPVS